MTILGSLVLSFLLRNAIKTLSLLGVEMYRSVERTLKAVARSESAKLFILDVRAFFRQLVEEAN